MSIRVPFSFTYKRYQNSELATKFDRFCHSPMSVGVTLLVLMVLIFYLGYSFSAIGFPEGVIAIVGSVLAVLILVCFIGSFFLGRICDRWRLSDKLALWDISGRKLSKRSKTIIAAAAVLLLLPGAAAVACTAVGNMQAARYHSVMSVLDEADGIAVTGANIVSYNTKSETYSTQYIPKRLQAKTPEDARYILRCTPDARLAGTYGSIMGPSAYRRFVSVELVDRTSGEVIEAQSFDGGSPPHSVSDGTKKDQYGSDPDESEVCEWVSGLLQTDR